MKRLLELKTLVALLLVVAMSSVFVACGDDDEPTTIDKKLLIGKKWEIVKLVTNGKEEVVKFKCEEKHDYTLFRADGNLVVISYDSDCKEDIEEDYKWELSDNTIIRTYENTSEEYSADGKLISKKTTIEKLYSSIKRLTSTELVIELSKETEDGKEVLIDKNKDGKQDKAIGYFKRVE